MEGFFTDKEIESKSRPDGKKYSCVVCGLYKDAKSPRIKPFGNFKKKILNIGKAPGELEDKLNTHWKGKDGKFLQVAYKRLGIDLFEDCLNVNACHCRPLDDDGYDRDPSAFEVECCRKTTIQIIEQYKPEIIILFGNSALYSVIGHRWKKDLDNISKWRGWVIPDQDFKAWICPVFHPTDVQNSKTGVEETIWMQDLERAFDMLDKPLYVYEEPEIEIIDDLSVLNRIRNTEITFDYETTGLKPHKAGHRIVCCAIATSNNTAYSFIMPKSRIAREPFVKLLAERSVMKIAHNMKFEESWSEVRLRQPVVNWLWDTMLCAHVLDNRSGITGLKFQVYSQFGVVDYASEVAPYLESTDGTSNGFNKLDYFLTLPSGKKKLLNYCGYDAINEYRLYRLQQSLMLPF